MLRSDWLSYYLAICYSPLVTRSVGFQESSKLYLKTDYKLYIAEDSRCTDHCRKHALSTAEPEFHEPCRHKNDVTRDRCEVLENTLTEIEEAISSENAQLRYGFLASKFL